MRRAILAAVLVASAMVSVEMVGRARALELLRLVLVGVLVVNWISPFVLQNAVHLANDPEPEVVGAWRGLYFHKNIAGAVTAISAIVFFFHALQTRRWLDWGAVIAALGFLAMTQSKTSMGLLVVALLAGGLYRLIGRGGVDAMIGWTAAALVFAIGGGIAFANWDTLVHMLQDPTQFTGRAAIWQAETSYIGDHPLLGSGYGTFADTGDKSPLYDYMGAKWIGTVAHGHNGYLELAVTTGLVGLAIAAVALVILPALDFARIAQRQALSTTMLFALFAFVLLHNAMESDFLEGDAAQWITFLIVIAVARMSARERTGPLP